MAREQRYDGGSKWLLEQQGPSLALLAGFDDVVKTEAMQPEMIQQRKIPDGLLKIVRRKQKKPTLLLVEFCTFPESRTPKQLADDLMLVFQTRKVPPEVLALVLSAKGQRAIPTTYRAHSEMGTAKITVEWKVQCL